MRPGGGCTIARKIRVISGLGEGGFACMVYKATKQRVLHRGVPPDGFLYQLVAWGKIAPDDIFTPNSAKDIYWSVFGTLGPWHGLSHRRVVMLEVLRVLAG